MVARFFTLLNRQPRHLILALGIFQLVLVGTIDYLTGPDLAFSIFYLFPVLVAVISLGRRAGFVASIMSAIAWLIVDMLTPRHNAGPAYHFLNVWNALVNLNFFLIITFSISAMRAARQKQDELLHFIVHDLRSPLSNVLMGMQALSLPEVGTLNPAQQEVLARAVSSGRWMETLINSLLDLSRLESGQMRLELLDVTVPELIEEAVQQVSLQAGNRGVHLERRNLAHVDWVRLDRALTVRILVNLLSNALKFTSRGKTVTLETSLREGNLLFSVIDQGPGIPKEYLAAVFDKFVQVEARQAGIMTGNGLGLTFCRLGVEAQGGCIWMESELGLGTTVKFILPLKVKPIAQTVSNPADAMRKN